MLEHLLGAAIARSTHAGWPRLPIESWKAAHEGSVQPRPDQ
jgi:hypothetical protein